MESPTRTPASVWALLGVGLLCYGFSSILVRAAGDVEPMAIASWRTIFVSGLLVPVAVVRARRELAGMSRKEWGLIAASGVVLGLHFLAYVVSVQLTTVAAASVLVTTSPLWIGVLGALGFGERADARTLVSIAVGVVGATLIGLGGAGGGAAPPNPVLGNALALGAAALVSVYYLIGRSVRQRASFLAYFAPVNAFAALTALTACLLFDVPLAMPLPALGLCFLMAVGPGLIGHGSFAVALGYLPPATLSLIGLGEPVLASAMAVVLFGEVPSPIALVGMLAVLVSIAVVVTKRRAPAVLPES